MTIFTIVVALFVVSVTAAFINTTVVIVAIIITSLKAASMGSLRELDHDGTNCFPVKTQNHA